LDTDGQRLSCCVVLSEVDLVLVRSPEFVEGDEHDEDADEGEHNSPDPATSAGFGESGRFRGLGFSPTQIEVDGWLVGM
jgi:hypothetical protein